MLLKHIVLWLLFNLALHVCGFMIGKTFTPAKGHLLLESVVNLTNSLLEVTPYLNSSIAEIPPNCIQMSCKFVCFNGISTDIELDILVVAQKNKRFCSLIEELRLYNYVFPEAKISHGFLGNSSDKVEILYIASSNITEVAAGAFANGIFKEIHLENLQLKILEKSFFWKISQHFTTLSIIQRQMPIETVQADFLCDVKYTIESLTLQAGLKSINTLTGGDFLLNSLVNSDFSYNDFGCNMLDTAFSKVSMLEGLDLSNSNLQCIPSYIFVDVVSTLEYINLSHNKLKTISRSIFGWREVPLDLKMYAEGNEWSCSCDLQQEMSSIMQHFRTALVCAEPEIYQGLTLFDNSICGNNVGTFVPSVATTATSAEENERVSIKGDDKFYASHTPERTTESQLNVTSAQLKPPDVMQLECLADALNRSDATAHYIRRPLIRFDLLKRDRSHVDVIVDSSQRSYESLVLIWFSKVTCKYYEMEINYNDHSLGCCKNISAVTRVKDLASHTAYTFCLVFKEQLTVSPFNCKSIYVDYNLTSTKSNAWLTRDMKITALIILIVGITLFLFAGILMTYLLIKRKLVLLKGSLSSNRVRPPVKKEKHEMVRSGPFTICKRRKSTDSEVSYESYINANVYEVIPAFENPNVRPYNGLIASNKILPEINNQDVDNDYLTPLESLPRISKRNSTDVLPELPAEVPSMLPPLATIQDKAEYARIGNVYFLDSHM